jgi:hypothetical protein
MTVVAYLQFHDTASSRRVNQPASSDTIIFSPSPNLIITPLTGDRVAYQVACHTN